MVVLTCSASQWIAYASLVLFAFFIAPPSLLYLAITYRKHHSKMNEKNSKRSTKNNQYIFYLGMLFYLVSAAFYTMESFYLSTQCIEISQTQSTIVIWFAAFTYSVHWGCLIILLFVRLYFVFMNTIHAISKFILYSFVAICLLGLAVLIFFFIAFISNNKDWIYWSRILAALSLFVISIWLISTFIYKLFLIARDSHNFNEDTENNKRLNQLMHTMIKYTILAIISLSITMLLIVGLFFVGTESDGTLQIIWNVLCLMDVTTNVICNTLFYAFAKKYYKRVCGCVEKPCKRRFMSLMEEEPSSSDHTPTMPRAITPVVEINDVNRRTTQITE